MTSARTRRGVVLLAVLIVAGFAALSVADTIVLNDGTVVEGTISKESSRYIRLTTPEGDRSFSRSDIKEVRRSADEESAAWAQQAARDFDKLDELGKALKNADALYRLERYDEIPDRVKPLLGKGTPADDMRIRWLLIETYERQGKWNEVESLLKQTLEDGVEADKIRAKAHLDIFEANPGYTLRKVGDRRARDFLPRDQYLAGKRPGALQDQKMMEAALLEYIDQILRDDDVSIYALRNQLDVDDTLEAINELLEADSVSVLPALTYLDKMHQVENSLEKVNAILPGFANKYELNLVRVEAEHVINVMERLFDPLLAAYPDGSNLATEADSRRLTADAREQWRESCEEFLKICRPMLELNEYLLQRARRYPVELRRFIKLLDDIHERITQMRFAVERNRDRAYL